MNIELSGVEELPEIRPGDDLAALIVEAAAPLQSGEVLVIAQKVVSKAEGRLRDLRDVTPSELAQDLARSLVADPRTVQVILDESTRVVRDDRVLIVNSTGIRLRKRGRRPLQRRGRECGVPAADRLRCERAGAPGTADGALRRTSGRGDQ